MQFSSKDFTQTKAALAVELPDRLHHANVTEQFHGAFSAERSHGVAVVDLPTKTISMTLGHLNPGQCTRRHRHNYETILYIVRGRGFTLVEDRKIEWKAGDAVYVPVWAWHHHVNTDEGQEAEYVACENAPLLQNLGGIALREESPRT